MRGKINLDFRYWLDLFNSGTGLDYSLEEFIQCGARTMNVERALIVREGFRREHDILPYRMMNEATDTGHPSLDKETRDFMLDEYYEKAGWDIETAIPKRKTLEELDTKYPGFKDICIPPQYGIMNMRTSIFLRRPGQAAQPVLDPKFELKEGDDLLMW